MVAQHTPLFAAPVFFRPNLPSSLSDRSACSWLTTSPVSYPIRRTNANLNNGVVRMNSASAAPSTTTSIKKENDGPEETSIFQCTVCQTVLPLLPEQGVPAKQCSNCKTNFPTRSGYMDMTASPGKPNTTSLLPTILTPGQSGLFQLPQVSYAYERGWRSQFKQAGFPGPSIEADLALEYLVPSSLNRDDNFTIIDLSCGSGIMSRRLVKNSETILSNMKVIACDLSHSMLSEAKSQLDNDISLSQSNKISFIRADVNNLPFSNDSLQAVHAGAALHCWPNLQDSLSQIYRCLKPGGKFFGTTFFKGAYLTSEDSRLGRAAKFILPIVERIQLYTPSPSLQAYRFFSKDELTFLFRAAGFDDVDVEAREKCAIVRCSKPEI